MKYLSFIRYSEKYRPAAYQDIPNFRVRNCDIAGMTRLLTCAGSSVVCRIAIEVNRVFDAP